MTAVQTIEEARELYLSGSAGKATVIGQSTEEKRMVNEARKSKQAKPATPAMDAVNAIHAEGIQHTTQKPKGNGTRGASARLTDAELDAWMKAKTPATVKWAIQTLQAEGTGTGSQRVTASFHRVFGVPTRGGKVTNPSLKAAADKAVDKAKATAKPMAATASKAEKAAPAKTAARRILAEKAPSKPRASRAKKPSERDPLANVPKVRAPRTRKATPKTEVVKVTNGAL